MQSSWRSRRRGGEWRIHSLGTCGIPSDTCGAGPLKTAVGARPTTGSGARFGASALTCLVASQLHSLMKLVTHLISVLKRVLWGETAVGPLKRSQSLTSSSSRQTSYTHTIAEIIMRHIAVAYYVCNTISVSSIVRNATGIHHMRVDVHSCLSASVIKLA